MSWTLEELGWTLHPPGDFRTWDGLLGWFLNHTATLRSLRANPSIRQWHRAATLAISAA